MKTTFSLRSTDISTLDIERYAASSVGCWSNGRQRQVFRVDLESLMGKHEYDNNEVFEIRLSRIENANNEWVDSGSGRCIKHQLSGLQFIGKDYDVATRCRFPHFSMTSNTIERSPGSINFLPTENIARFVKGPSKVVDLAIELFYNIDGTPCQYDGKCMPKMVWDFEMYPIKKIEKPPQTLRWESSLCKERQESQYVEMKGGGIIIKLPLVTMGNII